MKIDKTDVINAGHKDAWKYFTSTFNGCMGMRAYRHLINDCLDKKKANFKSIINGEVQRSDKEKCSFAPGDYITVNGQKLSLRFLVSIYTQSFFQFGRNCFDYIAQIIVVFFCKGICFRNVDFGTVVNKKDNISDERVRKYIEDIVASDEYNYLCDYNNTLKHNYDPGVSISVNTDDLDMIGKMPSFEKNSRLYDATNMDEQMEKVYNFSVVAINDLLKLIWPEKFN